MLSSLRKRKNSKRCLLGSELDLSFLRLRKDMFKMGIKLATMMIKSHCQNDQKRLKEYDLVNPYREKREIVLRSHYE